MWWVVVVLAQAALGVAPPAPHVPAPWDEDRAHPMFPPSGPVVSSGLDPVWAIALRDSGRRVEILTNRFRGPDSPGAFPLDSVVVRRSFFRTGRDVGSETEFYFGVAKLAVRPDGDMEQEVRWVPAPSTTSESRPFAGVGPVPRDGSQYVLSADRKFLLVLRLMHHAVNVWGETGHFGLLDYFDVSKPAKPRRICPTLEADGPLHNGAVSSDGSRVAVQILRPAEVGWRGTRVVILERTKRGLTGPRVLTPWTTAEGLEFAGRYLMLGMQSPPMPVPVETSTTDTLSVFDLGKGP